MMLRRSFGRDLYKFPPTAITDYTHVRGLLDTETHTQVCMADRDILVE